MPSTDYEEPKDSVCTTFTVEEGIVDEQGNDIFAWSFECTRCGEKVACRGDPRGFGGRPYSCTECGWVSLFEGDSIETFAEEQYVEVEQ